MKSIMKNPLGKLFNTPHKLLESKRNYSTTL